MAELFVFGTLWFWLLTAIALFFTGWIAEESGIGATICLIFYVGLLHFGGNNIVSLILAQPWVVVALFAGYFVLGTVWGVLKWAIYVRGKRDELIDKIRNFCTSRNMPFNLPIDKDLWDAYCKHHTVEGIPKIHEHKTLFMRWVGFWPLNLVFTLFNDLFRNICRHIYYSLAQHLQQMADRIFGTVIPKN
jgi:hypothetical protein